MEKIYLNNISLSYETKGKGSDVLLLHGFPSNIYMWNEIKNELIENGYRVTIIEQRGYPLSRLENFDLHSFNIEELSKDIEELIVKLKLDQNLTIVGHDWGSIVAWALTSREEVYINKLVSLCGGTEFPISDVYSNLIYREKPHYISSFQNVKKSANIIDNNLESFFRSAYRNNNQIGENIDLSLENVFINYSSESCVMNENEIVNVTREMAVKIANKSSQTLKIGKKAFYHQTEMKISDAYKYASEIMIENMMNKDSEEGINAFIEKRKPKWK